MIYQKQFLAHFEPSLDKGFRPHVPHTAPALKGVVQGYLAQKQRPPRRILQ
jgi:hypothetical protein